MNVAQNESEEVPMAVSSDARQNLLRMFQKKIENMTDDDLARLDLGNLFEKLDSRINPEIPNSWPDNQDELDRLSRSRKSTDRTEKSLFPSKSSSKKRVRRRDD